MIYNVSSCICAEFIVSNDFPGETVGIKVPADHERGGEGLHERGDVCYGGIMRRGNIYRAESDGEGV